MLDCAASPECKDFSFGSIRIDGTTHENDVVNTLTAGVWFAAWLYTIGFLHLSFWQGVLAIVIWPYYLGVHFAR